MEDAPGAIHQHDPETVEMVREHLLPADLADRVAGVFWSLSDPTRARIVHALTFAELCNADIADLVGLSESAVSHQMRELRLLNIVRAERHGRMVFYRLNDSHVRHIFEDTLRHVQED
jgi:ArsR family transcriptional regulator, lead/cadmium/zinc/bismuth-responsive transcriptional repressor